MTRPVVNRTPSELSERLARLRLFLWAGVQKRIFSVDIPGGGWVGTNAVSSVIEAFKQYVAFSAVSLVVEGQLKKVGAAEARECFSRIYQLTDRELVHLFIMLYWEDPKDLDDLVRLLSHLKKVQARVA